MRCKNCGAENDDSRFICEICGSPLYDENDEIMEANSEEAEAVDYADYEEEQKKKRNIIIGIVVAVVAVVAIIVGVAFGMSGGKEEETTSTTESTAASTTKVTTTKPTTKSTTESTTESTTVSTTAPTTTTTTAAPKFTVAVDIDGNGVVSGDGTFEQGAKTALVATADSGYEFAGWYDNTTGKLVASGSKYTINVKSNLSLTAKFEKITTTKAEVTAQ